jgi:hypothetical protein
VAAALVAVAPGASQVAAGPSFSDLANLPLNHDRLAQTLDMSAPISQTGPNGSFGMAAMANLPMNQDRLSQMIQMAAGGKLQGPGGGSQILANLKSSVWSQKEFTSLQDSGSSDFVSGLGAVAKSPAVGAAGMMLAESGLLGSHQGSWGGVGMGAAGGADWFSDGRSARRTHRRRGWRRHRYRRETRRYRVAAEESSRRHQEIYGVDIPQNSGTIKQVVSIAQSEFGNDIAVAVRSPKVRQLVMLYSEATGQKMPLSASTPYAGSLVESGGNLYQQASFQNNAWHSYQSDLPVLGGLGGSTYPTTPGPNTSTARARRTCRSTSTGSRSQRTSSLTNRWRLKMRATDGPSSRPTCRCPASWCGVVNPHFFTAITRQ